MASLWRGVIREYADRLPMLEGAPVVTLQEGGTPLIPAEHLSELTGAQVYVSTRASTRPGRSRTGA
jgi:threonine synthase